MCLGLVGRSRDLVPVGTFFYPTHRGYEYPLVPLMSLERWIDIYFLKKTVFLFFLLVDVTKHARLRFFFTNFSFMVSVSALFLSGIPEAYF